jgi:hypothetical protein
MKEHDGQGKCYRVEERTVVPPITMPSGPGGGDVIKQSTVFVVVEGKTERYLGQSGIVYRSSSEIRRTDFFLERNAAEDFAWKRHRQTGCTSPACAWNAK